MRSEAGESNSAAAHSKSLADIFIAYGESVGGMRLSTGASEQTIRVTFFRDKRAMMLTTEALTLLDLRARILEATASTKEKLPWLELATFGEQAD